MNILKNNNRGQTALEYVLATLILFSIAVAFNKFLEAESDTTRNPVELIYFGLETTVTRGYP